MFVNFIHKEIVKDLHKGRVIGDYTYNAALEFPAPKTVAPENNLLNMMW